MARQNASALLCVGSGLTRRYRLNTLQALAAPPGAHVQFRYSTRLIPDGVQQKLSQGDLDGSTVLLGHVDCTERGRRADGRCPIVPYREARLVEATRLGSIFVLRFQLGSLRTAPDLEAFQRTLPANAPRWRMDAAGAPALDETGRTIFEGAWCQEVPPDLQATIVTDAISDWQRVVAQLRMCDDFARQAYFYMIEGLRERRRTPQGVSLRPTDGEYRLKAGREYELRVFHFDPDSDAHTGGKATQWLRLEVSTPAHLMRSSPRLAVDSPYDLKSFHFGTVDTHRAEYGSLYLYAERVDETSDSIPDLFLPTSITGNTFKVLRNGFILGALLTSAQLVTVFSKGIFAGWPYVAAVIALLGFGTGMFVSFGMRKPL